MSEEASPEEQIGRTERNVKLVGVIGSENDEFRRVPHSFEDLIESIVRLIDSCKGALSELVRPRRE